MTEPHHNPILQTLADEREILRVVTRYCRALDTKDWAGLDDVFVAEATADLANPETLVGIEAIRQRVRAALEHLDASQHLVANHEINVNIDGDGDAATHRCSLQAQHVRRAADGGPNFIVAGGYDDRLARTPAGWRITHRTLTITWTEGNAEVVRG